MAKTNEKYEALKGMREIEVKFRSTDSLEIETLFFHSYRVASKRKLLRSANDTTFYYIKDDFLQQHFPEMGQEKIEA